MTDAREARGRARRWIKIATVDGGRDGRASAREEDAGEGDGDAIDARLGLAERRWDDD